MKTYNLNELNMLAQGEQRSAADKKQPKIRLPEFQFFKNRDRLVELLTKEYDYIQTNKGKQGQSAPKDTDKMDEEGEKDKIDEETKEELNGLTPEEKKEKDELWETGCSDWNKTEFHQFIQGCERFSRKAYHEISNVLLAY